MATLDWQLRRTGEVTLVELSVDGDHPQQVRIESHLRPVWPPRRRGVPARGWQETTFEGAVGEDEPLVVGYATPAPPQEPPAEITATGSPAEAPVTPQQLVRALGDSRPPRDVLAGTPPDDRTEPKPAADRRRLDRPTAVTAATETEQALDPTASTEDETVPEPTDWFEAVESRLAETERLAEATDADEIRAAVEAAGGIDSVRALQAQLDADRQQLREIRQRSARLRDQLAAVDLPLATLERVV